MSENNGATGDSVDIYGAVKTHLPFLRRFARALTGSQDGGDSYTVATLEAIIADRSAFDLNLPARVSLFRSFHAVWSSAGSAADLSSDRPTGLEAAAQNRISELTPPSREAFLLSSLEDFSADEISSIMNISADEVEVLHQAALAEIEKQTAARVLIIEDEPIIAMDI